MQGLGSDPGVRPALNLHWATVSSDGSMGPLVSMWEALQHLSGLPPFRHEGTPRAVLPRNSSSQHLLRPLLTAASVSSPRPAATSQRLLGRSSLRSPHTQPAEPLRPSFSVAFPPEPTWPSCLRACLSCEPRTSCPVVWLLLDTSPPLCAGVEGLFCSLLSPSQ